MVLQDVRNTLHNIANTVPDGSEKPKCNCALLTAVQEQEQQQKKDALWEDVRAFFSSIYTEAKGLAEKHDSETGRDMLPNLTKEYNTDVIEGMSPEEQRELKEQLKRDWETKKLTPRVTGLATAKKIKQLKPSFKSNKKLLQSIDKIPKAPEWSCRIIRKEGDLLGSDDCVKELLRRKKYQNVLQFAPEKAYANRKEKNQIYDEMWSADWWWETQRKLPEGAAIAPLILVSDKMQLSHFSGDKQAWPIYLMLGNIPKTLRHKVGEKATCLVGYIPILEMDCVLSNRHSVEKYNLFHYCMNIILEPLIEAGKVGTKIVCADSMIRNVFPTLSSYIADHPEQCLIVCCKENQCSRCLSGADVHGEAAESELRDAEKTRTLLQQAENGIHTQQFDVQGLRHVRPFWMDLPHCDIFSCITPDILHQLYKGVFCDHMVNWCIKIINDEDDIDNCYKCMPSHPDVHHFILGISNISQWTGNEYREMEKIFFGIVQGVNNVDKGVLQLVKAILNFIYYAHFESHTLETLKAMENAYNTFHNTKEVIITHNACTHFNIPKIHSMSHYILAIQSKGSVDGYSTEVPERLHIDFAKMAYQATNKNDYVSQMTLRLSRREAISKHYEYLAWVTLQILLEQKAAGEQRLETAVHTSNTGQNQNQSNQLTIAILLLNDQCFAATQNSVFKKLAYKFAKLPPRDLMCISVNHLIRNYCASEFVFALLSFLDKLDSNHLELSIHDKFQLYRQFTITLPPNPAIGCTPVKDRI